MGHSNAAINAKSIKNAPQLITQTFFVDPLHLTHILDNIYRLYTTAIQLRVKVIIFVEANHRICGNNELVGA